MEYCGDCDGCGWYEGGKTIKTECQSCCGGGVVPRGYKLSSEEGAFGNYAPGRFGLVCDNVFRLPRPVPFKSRQGKLLELSGDAWMLMRQQLKIVA
jgi:hypothetical protein